MQKTLLIVGAALLLGALGVLPQTPDGAGPAGKAPAAKGGPDAAAAGLVNTACVSCHTLDRVNNKKGDKAAWTATVTSMVEKGAALTGEQVELVADYLVRTAGTFTVTVTAPDGAAKGGGKKAGGNKGPGFVAKNVKVLNPLILPGAMQTFVEGLGLLDKGACSYCHVEDRSSDEKMQKVIARNMIAMTRDINVALGDSTTVQLDPRGVGIAPKQHVTCYTCHRGSPTPLTAAP